MQTSPYQAPDTPGTPPALPATGAPRIYLLGTAIGVQALATLFFAFDVFLDLSGWDTDGNSKLHNGIEFVAALGLGLGILFLWRELRRLLAHQVRMARSVQAASGAFHALLLERFDTWELTGAERDVALLSIKGLSIAEVAAARDTAEGTVKAQCNRIYRKAGVTGRRELVALFLEDLMSEPILPQAPAAVVASKASRAASAATSKPD